MNKLSKTIASFALAGAVCLGAIRGAKEVALNIMSHTGYNEWAIENELRDPKTYFTRGPYRGFFNDRGARENEDRWASSELLSPDPLKTLDLEKRNIDLNAIYLGLQENPLPISESKPTRLTNSENTKFYSISDFIFNPSILTGASNLFRKSAKEKILALKLGDVLSEHEVFEGARLPCGDFTNVDLHRYTLSFGRDEKGIYTSVYDTWDFYPKGGFFREMKNKKCFSLAGKILPHLGKPIHFYDRFYWTENGGKN